MKNTQLTGVEEWIDEQADTALARACAEFGAYFNGARESLGELLAENCLSTSQTRSADHRGIDAVIAGFDRWFGYEHPKTFAELALTPDDGQPCLVMYVRDSWYGRPGLGKIRSYLAPQVDAQGRIERIHAVSFTPSPWDCERTGIFPGMSTEALDAAREFQGERLARSSELQLSYLLERPLGLDQLDLVTGVAAMARRLGIPHVQPVLPEPGDEHVRLSFSHLPGAVRLLNRANLVQLSERHDSLASVEKSLAELLVPLEEDSAHWTELIPESTGPHDYFTEQAGAEERVLRRIKGSYRRDMVTHALRTQPLEEVPEAWLTHNLSPALHGFLSDRDDALVGGEDLPDLARGEVEVARVTLRNGSCDVTSLRARRIGDTRYALRMVGETEEECAADRLPLRVTNRPLSAEEVAALFLIADPSPLESGFDPKFGSFFHEDFGEVARWMGLCREA